MTISEAELRYLSSDWCVTVSFSDFLRLLKNEGVEIDCGW